MNCRQADTIIQESLDRALTGAERATLDTHLTGCAACRARWDEYRALSGHAGAWIQPSIQPVVSDSDFAARVVARIEGQALQDKRAKQPGRAIQDGRGKQRPYIPVWLAGAACTVLVAGIMAAIHMYLPAAVPGSFHPADWIPQPRSTPGALSWLASLAHDLPGAAARLWSGLPDSTRMPAWTMAALAAAFLVNAALYFRAASPRGRNLAR